MQKELKIMRRNYYDMPEIELRDYCKNNLEAFEHWSRRLIDEKMKERYGSSYFDAKFQSGTDDSDNPIMESLIKTSIINQINGRMTENPERFARKIDALVFEDIIYFFLKDEFYKSMFKSILEPFFSGKDEIRCVLERTVKIRNKLSHGNLITIREAEQCICYTNDFIDVYKKYYENCGKSKDFNVPVFIRLKDSTGNDLVREQMEYYPWEIHCKPLDNFVKPKLRAGDVYKAWVEVDGSYDPDHYSVKWEVRRAYGAKSESYEGKELLLKIEVADVAAVPQIKCILTTDKEWHRRRELGDDELSYSFERILPPIGETY